MAGDVVELTFSVDQHPKRPWRASPAVSRWVHSFLLKDANIATRQARFTVDIRTDKGEFVKGLPAVSRDEAEDLLARLRAECKSVGVHAFLVKHDAPSRFVKRAAGSR